MFSRIRTTPSTSASSGQIDRLRRALWEADAVLVGAGAGLSAAAGFTYSGERFQRYFGDFAAKYGIRDMYSGGFYLFPTPEEFWAYWSHYILLNRYQDPPKPVYQDLRRLLAGKDYFVLTTNVDHCFQKAGFDKKRLFYTQGDYGLFQCAGPCRQETFGNEDTIRAMVRAQGFTLDAAGALVPPEKPAMAVPARLLPRCPHCGRPLVPNLRCDERFAEDEGWHAGGGTVRELPLRPLRAEAPLPGAGRGLQHPRHHQVPLLAHDRRQSQSHLRLPQPGPGRRPARH